MNFAFSEEQEAFRDTLRRFLEARSTSEQVRKAMGTESGFDPELWSRLASELGLTGLAVPEEHGGSGFSFLELVLVFEEMGRSLTCVPYLSTTLATQAILLGASEAMRSELLPAIADGTLTVSIAIGEPGSADDAAAISTLAEGEGDTVRLTGRKTHVLDGHTAGRILVVARRPGTTGADGIGLYVVDGAAEGLERTPEHVLDETRKQTTLVLAAVEGRTLGADADWSTVQGVLDRAAVCLAGEMVGGAAKCLEMAVAYSMIRVQFAQPIGSFQAIKHKCAEMLLEVESARVTAYYAAWAAASDPEALPAAASLAKACCADAYRMAAAENIQIHGGIGFTWEHDAHLYYKRARSSDLLFGSATQHRVRIADHLGI